MRRSSSSSAEEVDTEDKFLWGLEAAIALGLEAVFSFEALFGSEVSAGVCELEEGAELIAFLGVEGLAVEAFCGSIVEVSAMVCES